MKAGLAFGAGLAHRPGAKRGCWPPRDVDAAAAELSPDGGDAEPANDDPVVGQTAVADAIRAVEAACDQFQHTHLLADTSGDRASVYGLGFEAMVGESTLRGIDLIEVNEQVGSLGLRCAPANRSAHGAQ